MATGADWYSADRHQPINMIQGTGVGIAEGGIGSLYGGTDPNDNSGVLQYVRIEFPGIGLTATA